MAGHKKEGLTPRQRQPFGYRFAKSEHHEPIGNHKQAQLEASLDCLGQLRTELNIWDRGGRGGPMPTPSGFGLRLSLSSSEIYWRSA